MKSVILVVAAMFSTTIIAQDSSTDLKFGPNKEVCEENLSIYTEFYKQKNYVDAYKPWAYLFNNAPKRTKNIYLHGPKIIKGVRRLWTLHHEERPNRHVSYGL